MARALIDRGFVRVRPLAGGFDAWVDAGFRVESPTELVAIRPAVEGATLESQ